MNLQRLFFLRESQNLTQEQMAKILNVTRAAISQWENNKEIISLDKLNAYANYFNVSMDYIVGFTNIKQYAIINAELNLNVIGSNLLSLRKQLNYSQEKLASELNTSHSTISAYENGKVLILSTFAYQICATHNISLDWLVGRIKNNITH